ncbi:MAG: hypothetical protein Q8R20_00065 [Nanoarchaeota archaeon]|nr:hypothetical protein [Nanoarchaeota archaeon]
MKGMFIELLRGCPIEADRLPPEKIGHLQNIGFRFQSETRWTGQGEVTFLRPRFSVGKLIRRLGAPKPRPR